MPVTNVTAGQTITEAWGDSVADSINALEPDTTAPVTQAHGDAAAAGTSARAARRDHRHGMPALGTTASTQAFGDAAAGGAAVTPSKSDHKHAMPADPVTAHAAAADPHTGYQRETEKAAASGYASLDGNTRVPVAQLGSGTADSTKFLRGDSTWQVPSASPIDYAESADISTQAFGDAPAAGASVTEVAGANHVHGMPSNPVTAHVAATAPHKQIDWPDSPAATITYLAQIKLAADTEYRMMLGTDASDRGQLAFGPGGTTAPDTRIYRDAAGRLTLDTSLQIGGPTSGNVGQATTELIIAIERAWKFLQTPGTVGTAAAMSLKNMVDGKAFDVLNVDETVNVRFGNATTGGGMDVRRGLSFSGTVAASITTQLDNYAPTDFAKASVLRLTPTAARIITGIDIAAACAGAGGAISQNGRVFVIQNASGTAANTLTLNHDVTSTAANRFLCPNNAAVIVRANGAVMVIYDSTAARWRVVAI